MLNQREKGGKQPKRNEKKKLLSRGGPSRSFEVVNRMRAKRKKKPNAGGHTSSLL